MDRERMSFFSAFTLPIGTIALGAAYGVAGLLLGILYFRSLWWNTRLFAVGASLTTAIALMIGRFVLLATGLALTCFEGTLPLLAASLGVLAVRFFVVRSVAGARP
jgi:F1F0 ATPase subunit 2